MAGSYRFAGLAALGGLACLLAGGCQAFIDDADREVYRLIRQRQRQALELDRPVHIDREKVPLAVPEQAYSYVPHPARRLPPAAFAKTTTQPGRAKLAPTTTAIATSAPARPSRRMTLAECLQYAFRHSREFQRAKEDLYLAALDLTLEKHLWTPQLTGQLSAQYANYGEIRDFDDAMEAVAEMAIQQKLPLGGQLTARIISRLMRDLAQHVTTAERGDIILEAEVPLLRGAGRVAREPLYQAYRDLIYATRTFERFRRVLAVDIATDYLDLLQLRARVENARMSYEVFAGDEERAQALYEAGRALILDPQQAGQEKLNAENTYLQAKETYELALDAFKIRLGMPTDQPLEPVDVGLELPIPDVTEQTAIETALRYRLDLLNKLDAIDDARRSVAIARNELLPDLNLRGTATFETDPEHLRAFGYEHKRVTWRGFVNLELPLDRKEERNRYRQALISLRRAQRDYELAADQVRLEVRRAMRRIVQQYKSLRIQELNVALAQRRKEAAEIRFLQGMVRLRDRVEAEQALLRARNELARARSGLRSAILEFRRDSGTLRVDETGSWIMDARADSK